MLKLEGNAIFLGENILTETFFFYFCFKMKEVIFVTKMFQ